MVSGLIPVGQRRGAPLSRAALAPAPATAEAPGDPRHNRAAPWRSPVIRDEDAQFHPPTSDDPLWAETNYFGLYAGQDTDRPVNIGLYALHRTTLGMVGTTVSINSRRVREPWAAEYWDAQNLPAPDSLLDYELPNGLKVIATSPNQVWDVDYSDPAAGVEIHFRYTAI